MAAGRPSAKTSGGSGREYADPAAYRRAVQATAQESRRSSGAYP
jgi:hypothetical protein